MNGKMKLLIEKIKEIISNEIKSLLNRLDVCFINDLQIIEEDVLNLEDRVRLLEKHISRKKK